MAYLNNTQHFASSLYLCGLALCFRGLCDQELGRGSHRWRPPRNELGHLVWQFNEVWPTGGWGSLEYGGRGKPHHYWYAKSLFRDVAAACDRTGRCYVRNDRSHRAFTGTVTIDAVNFATGRAARLLMRRVALAPGPAVVERFSAPLGAVGATRTVLSHHVRRRRGGRRFDFRADSGAARGPAAAGGAHKIQSARPGGRFGDGTSRPCSWC